MLPHFTDKGAIRLLGKVYNIYPDPLNEPVFALTKHYPRRFFGWIFVNPCGKTDPLSEINTWITSPGCIGIKAHPFWHRYPLSKLMPVAEQAARLKKLLLLHLGFKDQGDLLELVNNLPELKLILAHAAFPGYFDTWKLIRERKNVCVDLSSTIYVGEKIARDVVAYLGEDRCFFGTDGPYGPHAADGKYDYGYLKRRIAKLFSADKTRQLLLGESFAQFAAI